MVDALLAWLKNWNAPTEHTQLLALNSLITEIPTTVLGLPTEAVRSEFAAFAFRKQQEFDAKWALRTSVLEMEKKLKDSYWQIEYPVAAALPRLVESMVDVALFIGSALYPPIGVLIAFKDLLKGEASVWDILLLLPLIPKSVLIRAAKLIEKGAEFVMRSGEALVDAAKGMISRIGNIEFWWGEDSSLILANKGVRPIRTPREQALRELLEEVKNRGVTIQSDSEAEQYLDWRARQFGISPEKYYAATISEDLIFVRGEYADNVRILREELLHTFQQKMVELGGTYNAVQAEIEVRQLMIRYRHLWSITNDEVREMIRDIRRMLDTGRY